MATLASDNVDYRLLNRLSRLVICSQCLRKGKVIPVPQLIARNRKLTNLCGECRSERQPESVRRRLGTLLQFPQR